MNVDRIMFAFAGAMNLLGLVLGYWLHPYGFLLSAFVGLNMLQSAFTGFCPMAIVLKKMGMQPGCAFK